MTCQIGSGWLSLISEDDCTQILFVESFFWDSCCTACMCVALYSTLSPFEIMGLRPSNHGVLVLHFIRSLKCVPQSVVVEVAESVRSH